jgi:hypothetical protein
LIRIFLAVLSGILLFSCSKSKKEESTELNYILHAVLKDESARRGSGHHQYVINPQLQPLMVYVPTVKEISGEHVEAPSFSSKNIVNILDLNHSRPEERTLDSLYLLQEKRFIFDTIPLNKTINENIRLAGEKEVDMQKKIFQFSNPLYLNDHTVYIQSMYFDSSFRIGFGYLLEKQKGGKWIVKKVVNTFIT